ncbi:5-oxoprolinase subunit PxpB [Aliidiomarina maris]|uniref:Allophanate hydrolase n=1 Tax=Aliidiomarina maris TaxID=531312 RepID=A0A327X3H9_9GAMM|nr:5-oxoprolinase subunit PxpB [Aliidiomarina maris]MBA3988360.1 allophanate hydrolase [Idiomarina sp.]RAK01497.1 KipI family sensor histidine kinase inhibitor [Aliidiomarina maris]RUO28334.1 allophanate hydrolase [Aliidiomarina maris]
MRVNRPPYSFEIAGVNALLIRFGDQLNPNLPVYLQALRQHLLTQYGHIVAQAVPAYTTLLVDYDPRQCRMYDLQQLLERAITEVDDIAPQPESQRSIDIPVVYGGQHGPDLAYVAEQTGLSEEDVIQAHSSAEYLVYALGFAPGFSYLGTLPAELQLPRRATPRQQVPAGSVAIAGQQTAVYPQASPGGWHILGYSPIRWFDPDSEPMTPLQVGDRVRFVAIAENDIAAWKAAH